MGTYNDGKLLSGQQYDPSRGYTVGFTEQVHNYNNSSGTMVTGAEGQAATEITPIDAAAARVRVFSTLDPADLTDQLVLIWPDYVTLNLPDTLLSVKTAYAISKAEGSYVEDGDGAAVGVTSVSLSMQMQGSAQTSISVVPVEFINIKQTWATDVPMVHVVFFLATDNIDLASILTELTSLLGAAVAEWPFFRPEAHTLIVTGRRKNVSVRANCQQSVSLTGTSSNATWSEGEGADADTDVTVKAVHIPPTIHGEIALTGTTHTESADVLVEVGWPGDGDNFPARSAEVSGTTELTGSILFFTDAGLVDTIAATDPPAIPTEGLYLKSVTANHYVDGVAIVHAQVVDFAYFDES